MHSRIVYQSYQYSKLKIRYVLQNNFRTNCGGNDFYTASRGRIISQGIVFFNQLKAGIVASTRAFQAIQLAILSKLYV